MVDVYVAAAFSKDDKGGNKAGVVLGRSERSEEHTSELQSQR